MKQMGSFPTGWFLIGCFFVLLFFPGTAAGIGEDSFVQEADLKITCLGDWDFLSDLHVLVLAEETPFASCQLSQFEPYQVLSDFVISGEELPPASHCIELLAAVSQQFLERVQSDTRAIQEWTLQGPGIIHCRSKIRFALALGLLEPLVSLASLEGYTLGCCPLSRVWAVGGSENLDSPPAGLEFRLDYVPVTTPSVAPEGFIGMLRTGQTTIYNPGDDASYQRGLAQSLRMNGDGTLTDLNSGRTWLVDPAQAGINQTLPFDAARTACENLVFAGYEDWRLPSVEELSCLIDVSYPIYVHSIFSPLLETEMETYWTGTQASGDEQTAWAIDSAGGLNLFSNYSSFHVLPVRSDAPPASLADRFKISADGSTVFDAVTHLEWVRSPEDAGISGGCSFEEAISRCEDLVYAGSSDWRLPNRNEIHSLVARLGGGQTAFVDVIDAIHAEYWTSTKSLHPLRPFPWVFEARTGSINGRDYWYEGPMVLPVRAGLTTLACDEDSGDPTPTPVSAPTLTPTSTPTPHGPPGPVHPGGHVLVRSGSNNRIEEYDREGNLVRQFGDFQNPSAYVWIPSWRLLVATDKGLFAFDPDTREPQGLFCSYEGPAGFLKDAIRGVSGDLFLAHNSDHSIFRVDAHTGEMKGTFIRDPHLANPDGLAVLPNGNLVVTSGGYGGTQLLEFDGASGQFVRVLLDDDQIASPFDIERAEGNGDLFVSSRAHSCVVVVDSSSGQVKRTLGKGILSSPTGLLSTPDRHLLVADFETGSIHEFDSESGEHIGVFATVSANGPVFLGYIPGGPFNLPPSPPTVRLEPQQPLTSDDILCHATGSIDPEQLAVTYQYQWLIDGKSIESVTGSVLGNEWTHRDEVIECRVKASDGEQLSRESSDQVAILNTPPSLPVIRILPEFPSPADGLAVWFDTLSTDADGDEMVYLFEWYESPEGILWQRRPEISGNLRPFYPGEAALSGLYTRFTQGGEHWRVKVTPVELWTLQSKQIAVENLEDLPSVIREVVILYDLDGSHTVDALDLFLMSQMWYSEKAQVKENLRYMVFDPVLPDTSLFTVQRFLDYLDQIKK